jgi:hypothetical protein
MVRLLLPEPAGVETGLGEKVYDDPDTKPERLSL